MTVGVVDGKIIASGGWGDAGPDAGTWSYDPAANAWTAVAANPAPRAAAGQAVVDGKLYAVGGCTTAACTPMSNDVVALRPGGQHLGDAGRTTRSRSPSPPAAGSTASVYCTGGNDGAASQKSATSSTREPTPGPPSPTRRPTTGPARTPSPAASCSSSAVSRPVPITNAGFAYDPAPDSWSACRTPTCRGTAVARRAASTRSAARPAASPPRRDSEVLPGLEECAESAAPT